MDNLDIYRRFNLSEKVLEYSAHTLDGLSDRFTAIDDRAERAQLRVIDAMQRARVDAARLRRQFGSQRRGAEA